MQSRINRLIVLQRALAGRPSARVSDLEAELGVSRRTIFRDIRALRSAGLEIRFDPSRKGHTSSRDDDDSLPDPEALLTLLRHAAATSLPATTTQRRQAAAAAEALATRLPPAQREEYEQFQASVMVRALPSDQLRYAGVLEAAQHAASAGRCVDVLAPLPAGATLRWHSVQVLRLQFDLAKGWLLEGLLADSHHTCRVAFEVIASTRVGDRRVVTRLAPGKVEWTAADIEVLA